MTDTPQKTYFHQYLAIWIGQCLSLLGSSIVQFAIIWWLTIQTGDPLVLAAATFVGLVPSVVLSPIVGVYTDKWNRKIVMIVTDLLQAATTFLLIALFVFSTVSPWQILIVLLIRGIFQAIQFPATIPLIRLMVPEKRISQVNGLTQIFNSLIYIVSPAIGAYLLDFVEISSILWLDIITFLIAATILIFTHIPTIKQSEEKKSSFRSEFREGITYLHKSGLIPVLIVFTVVNIFLNPLPSLLPLYITGVHHGLARDYAFIAISLEIGNLLGSFLITSRKNYTPTFHSIYSVAIFLPILILIFDVVPYQTFWAMALCFLGIGVTVAIIDVQFLSIMQLTIPVELQGRVFSITFMLIKSLLPIALLVVGGIAKIVGVQMVYLVSPILLFIVIVIGIATVQPPVVMKAPQIN